MYIHTSLDRQLSSARARISNQSISIQNFRMTATNEFTAMQYATKSQAERQKPMNERILLLVFWNGIKSHLEYSKYYLCIDLSKET